MKTNKLLYYYFYCLPFLSFGQVSTYPDKSDFENGFGNWVNPGGDDFDWTWKLGSGTIHHQEQDLKQCLMELIIQMGIFTQNHHGPNYPSKSSLVRMYDMICLH